MLAFKERTYIDPIPKNIECLLGADIGGTNSNFGIFRKKDGDLELILSIHFKSKEITTFTEVVKQLLAYLKEKYDITISKACFGVAGVISFDRTVAKPTNLDFAVNAQEIVKETSITCAFLVNDFEIIGYGLRLINPKDLVQINKGREFPFGNKAVIGSGTGLGKCILDWNKYAGRYIPVASEGGHADMAAQSMIEIELIEFIKSVENFTCNVSWEDVLSGTGIQRIYHFFTCRNKDISPDPTFAKTGPHPDEIFRDRNRDKNSWDTYEMYSTLYARCAKNFALDALALNGVYIAGGIAANNLEMFKLPSFMKEFTNCGKQQELLKNVPIFVITDYNVSLFGAAEYMLVEKMCEEF